MRKTETRKTETIIIILLLIAIITGIVRNLYIFNITRENAESVFEKIEELQEKNNVAEKHDICIVRYSSEKDGWFVEKSTNTELEQKRVCVNTICNPRYLKVNDDSSMDREARYVLLIKKHISYAKKDGEKLPVVSAKKIYITNYFFEKNIVKFKNLSFVGQLRSVFSFIIPPLRKNF